MIDQTAKEQWNGYDSFDMYCDGKGCQEYQTFDDMDFSYMIKEAKQYGWTMGKDKDSWWHLCSECSKKEKHSDITEKDITDMEDENIANLDT